ncbi:MAG TPA: NADH:ubiquinone oxidoreductase subunit RnfD [Erysipelotrichaceae bacterium]|nr:NADH:ubiquinone oxidoreductase subunit RnfD [Erysipelotrichaceae bacterium]
MKFSYKPSPNYRNTQSTSGIMLDLTLCLLAVLLFAAVYYGVAFGASYGLRVVGMTAASTATALLTECAYFKFRKSKNIKKDILHSYGWVTALILTCITRIDVSYYSLIIATFICIIAGKLVFGGFGQNIFNPAAFGEALIMLYLSANASAKVTADVFTSATPMTAMNSQGWMIADLGGFLKAYGGFGGLMVGSYPSVIGGSCALVILLCFAFLLWRKDIDWHLSVTYLITVFCLSLIVGLIKGTGISYALFNVISGGVLFGTVFMMTDPVTTPITIPGRMIFAVGCAALTLILRWRANLPDGVLFSILLMNMLTPAIDKLVDGNQIKNQKLIRNKVMIASAVFLIVALAVGMTVKSVAAERPAKQDSSSETADLPQGTGFVKDDYSKNNAHCIYRTNTDPKAVVFDCTADGFGIINDMGDEYSQNELYITVDTETMKVTNVELVNFGDTKGYGDAAVTDEVLKKYAGITSDSTIDGVTNATFTHTSVKAMLKAALEMAAGK